MTDRRKEKLIHASIFFVKKTKHCHNLKLFKLLYFLDFEHFKQTGRSVTGLEYFAWPMGPVPKSLYHEIESASKNKPGASSENPALSEFFNLVPEKFLDPNFPNEKSFRFNPKKQFDKSLFSKREMEIMEKTVELFKDAKAKDMTTASHERNTPWYRVFKTENKPQSIIPYEYILDDSGKSISKELAEEIAIEDEEMRKNFG